MFHALGENGDTQPMSRADNAFRNRLALFCAHVFHKFPVELQAIHGIFLQIAERSIPHAEIIEHDLHAQFPHGEDIRPHLRRVFRTDCAALRDFKDQFPARKIVPFQERAAALHHLFPRKRKAGEVASEIKFFLACLVQPLQERARLLQIVHIQPADSVFPFQERNIPARAEQTLGRMLPAGKRLAAHKGKVLRVHKKLYI